MLVLLVILLVITVIGATEDGMDAVKAMTPFIKKSIWILIPFLLVFVFTPSSKTIAIMVVAPAIVNSEPIQKDLPELYEIAVEALKAQLKPEETK